MVVFFGISLFEMLVKLSFFHKPAARAFAKISLLVADLFVCIVVGFGASGGSHFSVLNFLKFYCLSSRLAASTFVLIAF